MKDTLEIFREIGVDDRASIATLLRAAFPGPEEATLTEALRAAGAVDREILVRRDGRVVGYAMLSRLVAPQGWLCLAPVAVSPDLQGRGIGRRLVTETVRLAVADGMTVVVLGDPGFYGRCGFSQRRAGRLSSPYPADYMLLAGPGDDSPEERLLYPSAFEGV